MEAFFIVLTLLLVFSPLWLLIGGGLIGRSLERKHFADMARREAQFADITLTTLRTVPPGLTVQRAQLVTGSMVVAADYFKSFAASLKTLVGGEMKSLQRMQERARREAILRMTSEARALGATAVTNVRIDTASITGKGKGQCGGVEVIASGTALMR